MDKELIDEIKNGLHAHEAAYAPGAWERFDAQDSKKPRFLYWPLWSAACIVLIVFGLFYMNNNEITEVGASKNIVKIESTISNKDTEIAVPNIKSEAPKSELNNPILNQKHELEITAIPNTKTPVLLGNPKNILIKTNTLQAEKSKADFINKSEQQIITTPEAIINKSVKKNDEIVAKNENALQPTFEQLLATDSKNNQLAKTDKNKGFSKWQQDIYVAPSMGNDNKLNMNYGFSVSYIIAKKLSISSGISYTALSTKSVSGNSAMNAPATISALSTNTKNLESVEARLRGINIPLELKYNITDKLYSGIGISAFATINNRQQNNYLISETKNTSVVSTLGVAERKILVVTDRVSEQKTENEVVRDKYLGFYNFSLGYKQKISSKKNIAIEPFISVPMKDFSKENLNLTNGGLKLKFEF